MAPCPPASLVRGSRVGAIAQLGERVVRNDEVGGSIPPGSTISAFVSVFLSQFFVSVFSIHRFPSGGI